MALLIFPWFNPITDIIFLFFLVSVICFFLYFGQCRQYFISIYICCTLLSLIILFTFNS
uniref:Uncharacterized protein n=1 Tax=uncultured marine virus TaxID=186617 RepID=A0A0F7LAW5_9VIRU|nr:hypothetical protein [uncultured marine virus]